MKKLYVEERELNAVNNAIEVLENLDTNDTARANINYELPLGLCLGEIVDALKIIAKMSEVVKD